MIRNKYSKYPVRPKKQLGQHFLKDEVIAKNIAESFEGTHSNILEIGPGTGVLSKYLFSNTHSKIKLIELDSESIKYLCNTYPEKKNDIVHADFLKYDLDSLFEGGFAVIGNFPYNISTQILFKVLDYKNKINEVIGMFQKEVAVRIASLPGKKDYGILSVLLQAFYNIEYLFEVDEHSFVPVPKVKSAVIRITRNKVKQLDCDEKLFKQVVKTAFNQRRKTLRNALKIYHIEENDLPVLNRRAETLSVKEYVELTKIIQKNPQQ
jgi:16S rRNA (adenine1518-N6/adenine1519-N6)-dimethyltransferase